MASAVPGVCVILFGLGAIANSRVSLTGVRAMRTVSAMHKKMAQDHQTEEAICKHRPDRHFEYKYSKQAQDDRNQEHPYCGGIRTGEALSEVEDMLWCSIIYLLFRCDFDFIEIQGRA